MKTKTKILFLQLTVLLTTGCFDQSREQILEAKVQEQARVIEHFPAREKKALHRGFGLGMACTFCVALLVAFVFKGDSNLPSTPPPHESHAVQKAPGIRSPEPQKPARSAVSPASSAKPGGIAIPILYKKPELPKRKINVDVSSLMGGGSSIGLMGVASLMIYCDRKGIPTRWICDSEVLANYLRQNPNLSPEMQQITSCVLKRFSLCKGGFVQSQCALQDRVIISNDESVSKRISAKRNVPVGKVEVHSLRNDGGRMFCRALGADPISILDPRTVLSILKLLSPDTRPKSLKDTQGQNGSHKGVPVAPR